MGYPGQGLTINEVVREAHQTAISKGFYTHLDGRDILPGSVGEMALHNPSGYRHLSGLGVVGQLLLIHSEVTEAMESDRRNEGDDRIAEELADIVIRVADLAGYMNLDLDKAIEDKMAANKVRPHRHGDKKY